jgi:hypothetical protein
VKIMYTSAKTSPASAKFLTRERGLASTGDEFECLLRLVEWRS